MNGSPRTRVLGCPVDVVDMEGAVTRLIALVERAPAERSRAGVVVTLNPEMVMRARRDAGFRLILEEAALLVPDGIGIVKALRRRGHASVQRVGGADLLLQYFPEAARHGHRIALAGAGPGVAAEAARRLGERFPGLRIVAADGGRPDAALAARLHAAAPDLVLAAFGAGAQEEFCARFLAQIGAGAGVGVGGALDYFSGRVRRAPVWVQRRGLEWAWRLVRQPWRLRRQAVLPAFWWLERREAG